MSWARVDDSLWRHPKFEALRLSGEHDAAALWLYALSYCGQKHEPYLTIHEAAMLLCCDLPAAEAACEKLRSRQILDDVSASKQTRSYLIHNWNKYRSKDPSKVFAGRKGGVKSGASRRGGTKQNEDSGEAEHEQKSPPNPTPVTQYPVPESLSCEGAKRLDELEQWGYKKFTSITGDAIPLLRAMLPITRQEFEDAAKGSARSWKYLAKVLASMREAPVERRHSDQRTPPEAPPRRRSVLEKFANQLGVDTGLGEPLRDEMRAIEALNPTAERLRSVAAEHQSDGDKCGSWQDVIADLRQTRLAIAEASAP